MSMEKLFVLWLGMLPLIIWNGAYERPKVFWFLGGSFFLFTYWLRRRDFLVKQITRGDTIFLLWIVVILISGLTGLGPVQAVIGGSYRYQGVLFFFAIWVLGKTAAALSVVHQK